jgi:enoyl-CoA hydratase
MIWFPLGRWLYHASRLAVKHDLHLLTCLDAAASTVGMSEGVAYSERDGIAEIALDDGKVNAMSMAFFDGLNAALDRAEQGDANAVVVSGRPGYFSAGLNIRLLPTLPPDEVIRTLVTFARTLLRVWTFPRPTIAAVTGHAVAGGALLAFACDRRFVADGAFRIQMNEVVIGLAVPSWAIAICQSVMPARCHNEALLHARPYTPAEARAYGMIDGVTGDAVASARAAAGQIPAHDRQAYAETKRRLRSRAVAWAEQYLEAEMVPPGSAAGS